MPRKWDIHNSTDQIQEAEAAVEKVVMLALAVVVGQPPDKAVIKPAKREFSNNEGSEHENDKSSKS